MRLFRGKLIYTDNTSAVVECGGVGFKCFTTRSTLAKINASGNSEETLFTYLNVREDALDLFGFYSNEELVALTKELTEELRKNKTIDWQKKESARAKMRMLVKRLLKKYKYPPEGQEDALKTVISQCEMWTDNQEDFEQSETTQNEKANKPTYDFANHPSQNLMVAEESPKYGK